MYEARYFVNGYAIGFNDGLKAGGGTSKDGDDIYIVAYSETSLTVRTIADRTADEPQITDHDFSFDVQQFKKVTTATYGEKQVTKEWVQDIIIAAYDSDNNVIWTLEPDESGKIVAVYDINGNELIAGSTNGDAVLTPTPEGAALGYALAYNAAKEKYTEDLINAYIEGIEDEEDLTDDGTGGGTGGDKTTVDVTDFAGGSCIVYQGSETGPCSIFYGSYVVVHANGAAEIYGLFMQKTINRYGVLVQTLYYDDSYMQLGSYSKYMGTAYDEGGNPM